MNLSRDIETRWAATDGPLALPTDATAATASVGGVSVSATVADGFASVPVADALKLMGDLGCYEIAWELGDAGTASTLVERVARRYCTPADVIEAGARNNDGFDDAVRYPLAAIDAAIQQAEETIERCTRRSFCTRVASVRLYPGLNELPVQDATATDSGELASDRQAIAGEACTARITYGAKADASIREACVRLASSALRPRVGAENARGQSADGVYTSYTLATGTQGSWTGIPYVDAVIEERRSGRRMIF